MSDFFEGMGLAAAGTNTLVQDVINKDPVEIARKQKLKDQAEREADIARRKVQVENATKKPGRRGTVLTEAERVGAGVGLPTDSLTTPYPFVTG